MKYESFIKPAIISVAIIITALILGGAFKNRNITQDSISVVGLGTKDFESDEILWTGNYSARAKEAKDAYNMINADKEKVKSFFQSKGFKDAEFS